MESVLLAILGGVVSGLISWGGIMVTLKWHRADIDRAHQRIDHLEERMPCLLASKSHR